MLKRIKDDDEDKTVRFTFDGREMRGRAGDSLAAALLANGALRFRNSPVSGRPRGPFCMMGVCFECLVEIDGVANCQACMVPLAEGMVVHSQQDVTTVVEAGTAVAGGAGDAL